MLTVKNVKVYDLMESVIACRNAMRTELPEYTPEEFEASLQRAQKLVKASAESRSIKCHDSFLSGIRVSFDLIYPNYISPEMQRYHWFDIVCSASKMHRLLKMDIDKCCNKYVSAEVVSALEKDIARWNSVNAMEWIEGQSEETFQLRHEQVRCTTKDDALYTAFMKCVSDCPQGIELFMRISTNYKQLQTMYAQRHHHKLREDWGAFCRFVEGLPYASELLIPNPSNL